MMFRRREKDLDEEIQAHLRLAQQDGYTPESARRQFGNITLIKETARDVWGWAWLETLLQDARYAIRTLARTPGFTAVAIFALTLGIGANTAIFSLVSKLLLGPLNAPDPDRIVTFSNVKGDENDAASPAKFNVWRRQSDLFDDVSAWDENTVNLTGVDRPAQVREMRASAAYFRLFRIPLAAGRPFIEAEDRPFSAPVAVLSDAFWKTRFGGDPRIVGRTITLSGVPHRVVGILAASFHPLISPAPEVWVPMRIDPGSVDQGNGMTIAARLKPSITLALARARLKPIGENFRKQFPGALDADESFGAKLLRDEMYGDLASSLLLFQGVVGFVLLIACANIANLLLVRASTRNREMAIRAALGASRGRMVRQLLTESAMLSAVGCLCGLGLGVTGMRALIRANPFIVRWLDRYDASISVDWRVLAFTLLLSLVSTILFGILPALQVSRADLNSAVKESDGRSGTGVHRKKTRSLLAIGEMALALVLLIGAGLLIHSIALLHAVEPGFETHDVLALQMSLTGPHFEKTAAVDEVIHESVRRAGAIPGVADVATTLCLPMDCTIDLPVIIYGRPLAGPSHGDVYWTAISPAYFETLRIPLLRGRAFTERDDGAAARVVVINQAMARKYWPRGNPLGARLILGKGLGPQYEDPPRQIVGIVGDIRSEGLDEAPKPAVYIPSAQMSEHFNAKLSEGVPLTWVVRTLVEPQSLLAPLESALRVSSGGLPVGEVRPMDELRARSISDYEFSGFLLSIFAASALLLAVIGIYGVMAYSVRLQTREIGIRLALGAAPGSVRNQVALQAMRLALCGMLLGLAAAAGLSRLLAGELYGVRPLDPPVFAVAAVVLCLAALGAAWFPARRASRIDPMDAIRHE